MFLQYLTLVLLFTWRIYFFIAERKTQQEKPKQKRTFSLKRTLTYLLVLGAAGVLFFQLLGMPLLPMNSFSFLAEIIGFCFVIIGVLVCIIARKQLGNNWVSGHEAQIKNGQILIQKGIYQYIRHPIYLGLFLAYVGGELVAKSYLFIPSLFIAYWIYKQGKIEEGLLLHHFGSVYKKYLQQTKMFIPFIF